MYYTKLTGNTYKDYILWRKSPGYSLWLKRQWAKQKGKCFYCKTSLKGRRHNVEHVTPMSRKGTNFAKNLVLSCPDCNKNKGSRPPTKDELSRAKRLYTGGKHKKRLTKPQILLARATKDYYRYKSNGN